MPFFIMWKNVKIGVLYGEEENVKYKVLFENLPSALSRGFVVEPILTCTTDGKLPEWINRRIPKNEPNKFTYLRKTKGRLTNDHIWFEAV